MMLTDIPLETAIIWTLAVFVLYKILDHLIRIPRLDIRGRRILVTGCDSGFGNLFAKRMASKGVTVFAGCYTDAGKTELQGQGHEGRLLPFKLDVADDRSIDAAYKFVCSKIDRKEGLWAVVNNAGITGTSAPVEWLDRADYDKVLAVNLHGTCQVTRMFLPLLKQTRGRVVNTCSIVGRFVLPFSSPYTVSKFAAEALSDSMRRELYYFGVSVHIIEPGFFTTAITDPKLVNSSFLNCWRRQSPDMQREYGEEFVNGCQAMVSDILPLTGSNRLHLVVDNYEHAITARFPRTRYMPGYDSRLLYWPLTLAPEWFSDGLLKITSFLTMPKPQGAKTSRKR